MKKIILTIIMMGLCYYVSAQCDDCPKDKELSTNPFAPQNCEVEDAYPGKTNQYHMNSIQHPKLNISSTHPSVPSREGKVHNRFIFNELTNIL